MNEYTERRLCPFCGNYDEARLLVIQELRSSKVDSLKLFKVVCDACEAEGPAAETTLLACERWNKRYDDGFRFLMDPTTGIQIRHSGGMQHVSKEAVRKYEENLKSVVEKFKKETT